MLYSWVAFVHEALFLHLLTPHLLTPHLQLVVPHQDTHPHLLTPHLLTPHLQLVVPHQDTHPHLQPPLQQAVNPLSLAQTLAQITTLAQQTVGWCLQTNYYPTDTRKSLQKISDFSREIRNISNRLQVKLLL